MSKPPQYTKFSNMRSSKQSIPQRKGLLWATSLAGACFILIYLILPSTHSNGYDYFAQSEESLLSSWQWNFTRDEKNYGLTERQCDIAFPRLYHPIRQSIGSRERPITHADTVGDVHWGECRAMLYNNELYVLDDWPDDIANNRKFGTLHAINRAVTAMASTGHKFPNIEFSLAYQDKNADTARPNWAYDRSVHDKLTTLIPDFGLYSWPAHEVGTWSEVREKTKEVQRDLPFEEKIPMLLWRGTLGFGSQIREALVNASDGKPWSAVEALQWGAADFRDHAVSMPNHCKYQFLAHTEGLAYSGRLKYLHNCESVIIAHEPEYETHDQHLMVASGPDQNYVRVKKDWSDLESAMSHLLSHPADAARIARNNVDVFRDRYLTPAAEACYWRKLIHEWGKHGFEPEFYKTVVDDDEKGGRGKEKKVWRGVPFESFVLMRGLEWDARKVG